MASSSSSSRQLQFFASLLIFLLVSSHSMADPLETDLCNGEDDGVNSNDIFVKQVGSADGCRFAGPCKSGADCGHACASLGFNPNSVKCLISEASAGGGGRCCCRTIGVGAGADAGSLLP